MGQSFPLHLLLVTRFQLLKALEVRQLSSVPCISHQLCYRCGSARQVRKTGVAWLLFRKATAFCLNPSSRSLWPFTCMSDWWSLLMSKGQNIYPSMSWCQRFLNTFLMKGCKDHYTNEDHFTLLSLGHLSLGPRSPCSLFHKSFSINYPFHHCNKILNKNLMQEGFISSLYLRV